MMTNWQKRRPVTTYSRAARSRARSSQPAKSPWRWALLVVAVLVVCLVVVGTTLALNNKPNQPPVLDRDPGVLMATTIGGSGTNSFSATAISPDGTIVGVGFTDSSDGDFPRDAERSDTDAIVAKVDADGHLLWSKSYGGTGSDLFVGVAVAPDGSIFVCGATKSTDGDFPSTHGSDSPSAVVAKLTPDGEIAWVKVFGGSNEDVATGLSLTKDGGVLVGGYTVSSDGDFATDATVDAPDAMALKLTGDGTLSWLATYHGDGVDEFSGVVEAADGSIVAAGSTSSTAGVFTVSAQGVTNEDSPPAEALVASLSASGQVNWFKTYRSASDTCFEAVGLSASGEIVATGWSLSAGGDFPSDHGTDNAEAIVAKLGADGTTNWTKALGGSGGEFFESVLVDPSGAIFAAGYTSSTDGDFPRTHGSTGSDAVIVQLAPDGTLLAAKTYGGTGSDQFLSIAQDSDGSLVAAGSTLSPDGDFPSSRTDYTEAVIARLAAW